MHIKEFEHDSPDIVHEDKALRLHHSHRDTPKLLSKNAYKKGIHADLGYFKYIRDSENQNEYQRAMAAAAVAEDEERLRQLNRCIIL